MDPSDPFGPGGEAFRRQMEAIEKIREIQRLQVLATGGMSRGVPLDQTFRDAQRDVDAALLAGSRMEAERMRIAHETFDRDLRYGDAIAAAMGWDDPMTDEIRNAEAPLSALVPPPGFAWIQSLDALCLEAEQVAQYQRLAEVAARELQRVEEGRRDGANYAAFRGGVEAALRHRSLIERALGIDIAAQMERVADSTRLWPVWLTEIAATSAFGSDASIAPGFTTLIGAEVERSLRDRAFVEQMMRGAVAGGDGPPVPGMRSDPAWALVQRILDTIDGLPTLSAEQKRALRARVGPALFAMLVMLFPMLHNQWLHEQNRAAADRRENEAWDAEQRKLLQDSAERVVPRPIRWEATETVSLHSEPESRAERVSQLPAGTIVETQVVIERWHYVRVLDGPQAGLQGWLFMHHLRLAPDEPAPRCTNVPEPVSGAE